MKLFRRSRPDDVLYLTPVKMENEQLPKDKIRMLFYDTEGEAHASLVENSVYELAKKHIRKMKRDHSNYATLGLEVSQGKSIPVVVEISAEELWALERIQAHALKRRRLPDILKKYLKQIIKIGEARRQGLVVQQEKPVRRARSEAKPRVLERLSYYSEDDTEISVPIYKAEHSYPLIVLKQLNGKTPQDMQRMLILDSDGDLAVVRIPVELIDKAQKDIERWQRTSGQYGCIIYSQARQGFKVSYMAISELQRAALDRIIKSFEETGFGRKPVSTAAQEILVKAKDMASYVPQ
jgi:hypothetical protein